MKKFELTSETKAFFGKTLYRIRALISFGDVSAGDLGGFVEKEENLDQSGDAWVAGNAVVDGDSWVAGNAVVSGDAWVAGNARVSGDSWVAGNAVVDGDSWVAGNAVVSGDAWVAGNAVVDKIGAIFWVGAVGSRNDTTTFFKCKDGKVRVTCGCFLGDLTEFAEKVNETHGDNEHGKVYMLAIEMAKTRISLEGER